MSYHSERYYHLDRISAATSRAKDRFINSADLEDEHAVIKELTKSVIDELMALTETCSGERVWGFDVQHEGVLENVAVSFSDAIDKRDDRRSPESRKEYAAAMGRM